MLRHINYKIKSFFKNAHNLIKWFPIVWNDRDYDWNPLVKVIAFKLDSMSEFHKRHGYNVDADKVAQQLKDLSNLANKIATEDYSVEVSELDEFQSKISEFSSSEKGWSTDISTVNDREIQLLIDIGRKEEELLSGDIEKLFDEMKKHLRGWWD